MTYKVGEVLFDKYRIEELLGAGSFGEVYRVTHLSLGVLRAVKVLRHDTPGVGSSDYQDVHARFQLEARLGAWLNSPAANPHLLQVHDLRLSEDVLLLEMEYAPGGNLAKEISASKEKGSPLSLERVLQVGVDVAGALSALHAIDVVHRDLKPANIMLDGAGRAKVADLGLAQVPHGPSQRSQLSSALRHPGTAAYMSPEQENSTGYLTSASDVYALGAVLYELLTGRVYRSLRPGTRVTKYRAEVPEWLDGLLMQMLSEYPRERPWDGAEVLGLIEEEQARLQREAGQKEQARLEEETRRKIEEQEEARRRQNTKKKEKRSQEYKLGLAPDVTMEFMRVPAGEFLMGSDPKKDAKAYDDEQPQRKVDLDEYLIGKYPVTNRQYAVYASAKGLKWEMPLSKEDHPVVNVSWDDASAFCAWVSQKTGAEIRLPTEAEWEKAARGVDGRIYPWADKKPDKSLANFNNNENGTTPVGKYSPLTDSLYGCSDMAGNVWEWCVDWYDGNYYKKALGRNPSGPSSGKEKVLRGGGWYDVGSYLRSSFRNRGFPFGGDKYSGFRCARGTSS